MHGHDRHKTTILSFIHVVDILCITDNIVVLRRSCPCTIVSLCPYA